jgi:hypothetical protein
VELYLDYEFFGLYVDSIELSIQIPTWLLLGSIALSYSIHLLRKDR